MDRENNIKGAKRALLFAVDFKADLTLPIRYAVSTNDKELGNLLQYYQRLSGKDAQCYPNYFENLNKVIKSKKSIMLSDITVSISNKAKKRRR